MKKAIVITLGVIIGVIIGVTGVLAICAHLADAARLALYAPEDEDDEDIYRRANCGKCLLYQRRCVAVYRCHSISGLYPRRTAA